MTTQVIFKIDKKLKAQAMKKAKGEGVAFSSVLKLATKAYIDGDLDVGLVMSESFNSKTRRLMDTMTKDIKQRKNLSPQFDSAKEAIKWLNK